MENPGGMVVSTVIHNTITGFGCRASRETPFLKPTSNRKLPCLRAGPHAYCAFDSIFYGNIAPTFATGLYHTS